MRVEAQVCLQAAVTFALWMIGVGFLASALIGFLAGFALYFALSERG